MNARKQPIPLALRGRPERKSPYEYRQGDFNLSTSFRDPKITRNVIETVGWLARRYRVQDIAEAFGFSQNVIRKMIRISHATYDRA